MRKMGKEKKQPSSPLLHLLPVFFFSAMTTLPFMTAYVALPLLASPELAQAYQLTQDFLAMVRKREGYRLDAWLGASRQATLPNCNPLLLAS
jgi:hypothetical protein